MWNISEAYLWELNYDLIGFFVCVFSALEVITVVFTCVVSGKCDIFLFLLFLFGYPQDFLWFWCNMCLCVKGFGFILLRVSELLDLWLVIINFRRFLAIISSSMSSSHSENLMSCRLYHLILSQSSWMLQFSISGWLLLLLFLLSFSLGKLFWSIFKLCLLLFP